jgi:hypothetical protein
VAGSGPADAGQARDEPGPFRTPADGIRRRVYDDLFTLWKNADPDIPVLKEARAEYTRLP